MKDSLRQSMAVLHTWAGLLMGWLLFAMFTTGTAAYFQDEITAWMTPELAGHEIDSDKAASGSIAYLTREAPDAASWYVELPSGRLSLTRLSWSAKDRDGIAQPGQSAKLDGMGQPLAMRETEGGRFLYRFHFDLHYMPVLYARYLVGVAALFMLVAIISGVITHKKIFTEFFTLRLFKGQRSWLDLHNLTAVPALPFHAMITFTGLVTLAMLYMPFGIVANYTTPARYFEALEAQTTPASDILSPQSGAASIDAMVAHARRAWDGKPVGTISVIAPGTGDARWTLRRASYASIDAVGETLTFDAAGHVIAASKPKGAGLLLEGGLIGLHAGRFASVAVRWFYFLISAGGVAMAGSGLVLWTEKRRQRLASKANDTRSPHPGIWLVQRLNIAVLAGLSCALPTYFIANRLLPIGLEKRAEREIACFFAMWFAILGWSLLRRSGQAWPEALGLGAFLFMAVPLVDLSTTSTSLGSLDPVSLSFNAAMVISALLLLTAFARIRRLRPEVGQAAGTSHRRTASPS